ncbi:peptidyl-tRNA hydrolase domain-containing protein 1 [Coemansia sp. IMI 203386]|nr:peptidyl-tRNA hydrolase domain-containing protein 1 [Coemansia sp. IMI 203386]
MTEARTIFIVMRKDLQKVLNWPLGSIVAQGCHATTAVIWKHRDDERVKSYTADLESMHKVTLETKNEASLLKMADNLKEKNIPYHLWIEQPENIPTCLATVPRGIPWPINMRSGKAAGRPDLLLTRKTNGVTRNLLEQFSDSLQKANILRGKKGTSGASNFSRIAKDFFALENNDEALGDLSKVEIASLINGGLSGMSGGDLPPPSSPKNTQRYLMYKAIHRRDPEGVWNGFEGILKNKEWRKVTEYDITRVMQTLNMQYAFERKPEILDRLRLVSDVCKSNGLVMSTIWGLNETIRFYIAEGRRAEAYRIKLDIESGAYGPDVRLNVHTYAALFSNPSASNLSDLIELTGLFDEMISKGISPNIHIEKGLIKAAQKVGEFRLLDEVLKNTEEKDGLSSTNVNLYARFSASRGQAYLALRSIRPALAELHRLLSMPIPRDKRPIPYALLNNESKVDISIPLKLGQTRDAYFVYLRSLYESIIRITVIRGQIKRARELLDDLRTNCYLPPTQTAYSWFVRYYAKRKHIDKLVEIQHLMLQDGVAISEHIYTKFMTACMFSPKQKLVETLVQDAKKQLNGTVDNSKVADTSVKTHVDAMAVPEDKTTPAKSGLPTIPTSARRTKQIIDRIYFPKQCINFFDDMLIDLGVSAEDIDNTGYKPNVSITNAVMRAYLMLEAPENALREYRRLYIHQLVHYPSNATLDTQRHVRTMGMVFKMALEAAVILEDKLEHQRIQNTMIEYGIQPTS